MFGAGATSAAPASALDSAALDAANQFEYDEMNRAASQTIVGAGPSSVASPSATGALGYVYDTDGLSRGVGINAWSQETTITLPNGTTQDVYTTTPASRCSAR